MVLGGLQKNSLIDYPKKVSCVLFFSGCNFNCPYCHNPELAKRPLTGQLTLDVKNLFTFLRKRTVFLDGVVISGGEPTLQKDLRSLCEKIKAMGYSVKLDTNGSQPHMIQKLIDEGLVDYIAMDIKTDPDQYAPIIFREDLSKPLMASIQIIMESKVPYEFRTTCVKPLVDLDVIERIAGIIKGARRYVLQQCRVTKVLNPEFFAQKGACCSEHELMDMESVAAPWVEQCAIR
jgi:pyruvate formate lyase activating enzyme